MGGGGDVGGGQGAGAAWKKSKRFHFVLRAFEAATVSCKLAKTDPTRAPGPLFANWAGPWIGAVWALRLFSLALSRPQPVSIVVSTRSVLSSVVKWSFSWEIFVVVMGGKFCALKFKRPPTPLNIGPTTAHAGLRRQEQQCKVSIQPQPTSTLDMAWLFRCLEISTNSGS